VRRGASFPVFYDPAGRRRLYLWRLGYSLALTVASLAEVFIFSVLVSPALPQLNLRRISEPSITNDIDSKSPRLNANRAERKTARAGLKGLLNRFQVKPPAHAAGSNKAASRPLALGFYVNWDDSSYESLKRHLDQLDRLVPEWLRLQAGDQPIVSEIDPRALDLIRSRRPDLPIIPMIHNMKDGEWEPQTLARQIADEASRSRLVNGLAQFVGDKHFHGVCIDFEDAPAAARKDLLAFMRELHAAFKQRNWTVMQVAPFDDSGWDYRAYAAASDYLLLTAYDEHWGDGDPGSVAGQPWFEETLARRMEELDGAHTIICIGGYGYDWRDGGEARTLTFQEALLEARDSEARVEFDPETRNPFFSFEDEDGSEHTVWFLDGVTAFNQMRVSRAYDVAGFALWRMGSEDPSLWTVFGAQPMDASPDVASISPAQTAPAVPSVPSGLTRIVYGYDVDFEGVGEILQVEVSPKEGSREIEMDAGDGLISSERYLEIPSPYVIRRVGWHPGMVALTFDDGPDEVWTPQILDILKRENVRATFFIIGKNGQANPGLVKRIIAEGHDIGNHTFTHPNLGEIPGRMTELELTATQRLIESLTGRSTRLFRAPYFGDAEPQTPDEVEPAAIANRLGYVIAGLRVDPNDWDQPGADAIVERAVAGVENSDPDKQGQVVLLHDGGGDRSQTVEALTHLIRELRDRGYRFATISQLAGMTRDQAMPFVTQERGFFSKANVVAFYAMAIGSRALQWIFLAGIALGLARLAFIGALAFADWRRSRKRAREQGSGRAGKPPFVSVIIPAYNEDRVIAQAIASLLGSTYPRFEIIVIDDGSCDRTSDVVRNRFGDVRRVRLFTRTNVGKAGALNFGLRHARGEIVVALDADTIFPAHTLGALVRPFDDALVGAVAGNAKVGNRINLLTRWQALEYVTMQNLDRRAFALLNCITVVPGAVGAWRRELLEQIGGFSSDTLAEDQDLTLEVRKLGYKIGYEEGAVALTEAPDTLRGLAKQRFRWSFGTLQCMWKHRDALVNPLYGALGFLAMPNVWIFQILFTLISPVMDLMFVWTFVSTAIERWWHPDEYSVTDFKYVFFYYALFLVADALAATFAFLLEKREQWSLLWWLFLQRFCYRQVMYYVMARSVLTAIKGVVVGWGKLERKATVMK
jgi:cellulose synthase/poly-beta-1,6-N-acetylglucosamine synthase-like glycosyltransferase/peptidoglycan/xylan/chitin deacetylase (PgdA/CDA1 family)/spore germination protein YaaH